MAALYCRNNLGRPKPTFQFSAGSRTVQVSVIRRLHFRRQTVPC